MATDLISTFKTLFRWTAVAVLEADCECRSQNNEKELLKIDRRDTKNIVWQK